MNQHNNTFYLYIYYDSNNTPFYVGIGKSGSERHLYHMKVASREWNVKDNNTLKINKIRKLLKSGHTPEIKILYEGTLEEDIKHLEKFYIKLFGRIDLGTGTLTNLTDGGDGHVNWSAESREKMSNIQRGKISVKDSAGNKFRVKPDDPRWISGELVGQTKGTVNSNINGKLNGYILAKNKNGEKFRVKPDDPRWISGELVGINKGVPAHPNTRKAAMNKKGFKKSKESVERGASKIRGVPKSDSHKSLISSTMKSKPDIECPHCGRILRPNSLGIHIKKSHPDLWVPSEITKRKMARLDTSLS